MRYFMRYYLDGVGKVFRITRVDDQGFYIYELLEGTEWIGKKNFNMSKDQFDSYGYVELSKADVVKRKLKGEL